MPLLRLFMTNNDQQYRTHPAKYCPQLTTSLNRLIIRLRHYEKAAYPWDKLLLSYYKITEKLLATEALKSSNSVGNLLIEVSMSSRQGILYSRWSK
jgi:hypothetical protein